MKRGKKENDNTKHQLTKRESEFTLTQTEDETESWRNGRGERFVNQAHFVTVKLEKNPNHQSFFKDKTWKSVRVQLHFTVKKLEKQLSMRIWSCKSGFTELNYTLSLQWDISCSDNLLEKSKENIHKFWCVVNFFQSEIHWPPEKATISHRHSTSCTMGKLWTLPKTPPLKKKNN